MYQWVSIVVIAIVVVEVFNKIIRKIKKKKKKDYEFKLVVQKKIKKRNI